MTYSRRKTNGTYNPNGYRCNCRNRCNPFIHLSANIYSFTFKLKFFLSFIQKDRQAIAAWRSFYHLLIIFLHIIFGFINFGLRNVYKNRLFFVIHTNLLQSLVDHPHSFYLISH